MAVLVVGLLVLDGVARRAAQESLASVVQDRTGPGSQVSVHFGGALFVPPLLTSGKVDSVRVSVSPLAAGRLTLRSVELRADDVELDRAKFVTTREVVVRHLASGTVTVLIDDAGLSAALGIPIAIHPGKAQVTVPGIGTITSPVVLRAGRIVVPLVKGRELSVPLPALPIVPCASQLELQEAMAKVTCAISSVPDGLLRLVPPQAA